MPIKKRTASASVQEPAPEVRVKAPYVPSEGALIAGNLTGAETRTLGHIAYAGADPMSIPTDDLLAMVRNPLNDDNLDKSYRNRVRSKATAARSYCVLCAQSAKGARLCVSVTCPLWAFRMGGNPFRRKK